MTFIVAMLLYIFGLNTTVGPVVPVANTNNTFLITPQPTNTYAPASTTVQPTSSVQTPPPSFYSTSPAYESFIN